MLILTFVVAIAVGTLLIYLFSRWIGRVKFTLANAFWGSAIGHIVPGLALFALGFLLHGYLSVAFVIGLLVALLFQTVLFRIIASTQNEVLRPWRAAVIALIVVVGDFLIASPILELIQRGTGGGSNRPNQSMELTATRRTTSFCMTSTPLPVTERAPGRGSSSCSR